MSHRNRWQICCVLSAAMLIIAGCGGGEPAPSGDGSARSGDGSSSSDGAAPETSGDGSASDGSTAEVSTEGWGHLKGKFIVTGAPEPAKIAVAGNDVAYCGEFKLVDESVVAGPAGELANVVLMPYAKRGESLPEPHESYADTAKATVLLNNEHCRFQPHVALLRTTQTLQIKNSDTVGHNTNIKSEHHPINPIISPGQTLDDNGFTQAERLPAGASCNIHPWMKGWLVVSDSPYMAVSDDKGEFLIENLPAGKHTFTVWQEQGGYLQDVSIGGKPTQWSRGRVEVIIKDGETTDLGEVTIAYDKLSGGA